MSHAADVIGKSRIRAKGIEPGKPRKPAQLAISEPVGCFKPIECNIEIAEARVYEHKGNRRSLPLSAKLIEFLENVPGFLDAATTDVDMSQESEGESRATWRRRWPRRRAFCTPHHTTTLFTFTPPIGCGRIFLSRCVMRFIPTVAIYLCVR
jgi:hypothetical protein